MASPGRRLLLICAVPLAGLMTLAACQQVQVSWSNLSSGLRGPVRVPTAGESELLATIESGRQLCRAGDATAGREAWRRAQPIWNGLNRNQRQTEIRGFLARQLGNITFTDEISTNVANIARVTADGIRINVAYSGDFTRQPRYQTPFDMPLTISPRIDGFPWGTALHFFCYEGEVMRVRYQIAAVCRRIGQEIVAEVRAVRQPVTQAAYDRFMARHGTPDPVQRLAYSWMFERIAAEPDNFDGSCDMSVAASHPSNYDRRIQNVTFVHDTVAEQRGRQYCACT